MVRAILLRGINTARQSHYNFNSWAAVITGSPKTFNTKTTGTFIRPFHSSSSALDTVRRRRRGGSKPVEEPPFSSDSSNNDNNINDGSDGDGRRVAQHRPVQDPLIFRQAASDLFDKLERALEPMKAKNDFFVVQRMDGEIGEVFKLDLGPKEGFYELEVSEDECIFQYSSPISGHILYCLSANSGEWVGCDDGHLFEGIFVRDLIRQCQGLPNL